MARRKQTSTSEFGVGKRESHDSSAFYERFEASNLRSVKDFVPDPSFPSAIYCGDSTDMSAVPDDSVALVVTSPPYFAGKKYEIEFEREGVPASYLEYLEMLHDVFAECVRVLEPGGRIAVNVANLGRKPYRSLSADVIHILQDRLGLFLRGEIIWQKGEGANGSCAWGSFRNASNPVLRDITERVVVASKGQLERALERKKREAAGLPHATDVLTEDFMASTLDVWNIPPESAKRVNHPAPFPVELPQQLIELYTYRDDLVLDPFLGSGSSVVAAIRSGRRYVGYDLDPAYVEIAAGRIAEETAALAEPAPADDFGARVRDDGKAAQKLALEQLEAAGFRNIAADRRLGRTGVVVNYVAEDATGGEWYVDVAGSFTKHRGGLLRTDVVWRTLGRAAALKRFRGQGRTETPLLVLTSHLPRRSSEGDRAMRAAGPDLLFDVVDMLSADSVDRLRSYCSAGAGQGPQPGFWSAAELDATD
ncbi:MAG: site-specific DNA-methyltransferase [Acidimicrobiales bacterium]